MKLLFYLLFPVVLFAQNSLPDTLILTNGKIYSCFITGMTDESFRMIYGNYRSENVIMKAVSRLTIEDLGTIYLDGHGLTMEQDQVKEFIENRMQRVAEEETIQKELLKLSGYSLDQVNNDINMDDPSDLFQFQMKKWSFGVLLIPYYSGRVYEAVYFSGPYPPDITTVSYANSEINMQGQLAYLVDPGFMLTLDVTYSSSYNETKSETHNRNEYTQYDYGYKSTDGLYLFDFSLGVKYYFLQFYPGRVNIYALAGFGKQFASAEVSEEDLFPGSGPEPVIEDNAEEYLQGLNSPFHFDFGFGAEYLFNESLSLNSNIRFLYASISSNYDYRSVSEYETATRSIDYKNSEFITRIGLGLNFYF